MNDIESYRKAIRESGVYCSPFRLGIAVGEDKKNIPSPYKKGSKGDRNYLEGVQEGLLRNKRTIIDATESCNLSGDALNHAVALAAGVRVGVCRGGYLALSESLEFSPYSARSYSPSTDWSQGGPLLQEYAIGVIAISDAQWRAIEQITHCSADGETYLVAAMRCFVEAHKSRKSNVICAHISSKCPDTGHLKES